MCLMKIEFQERLESIDHTLWNREDSARRVWSKKENHEDWLVILSLSNSFVVCMVPWFPGSLRRTEVVTVVWGREAGWDTQSGGNPLHWMNRMGEQVQAPKTVWCGIYTETVQAWTGWCSASFSLSSSSGKSMISIENGNIAPSQKNFDHLPSVNSVFIVEHNGGSGFTSVLDGFTR